MIWENWVPLKKNKRETLIKKMVLKRLGDEIRPISYQKFAFSCQNDVLVDQNDVLVDQNVVLVDQNVVLAGLGMSMTVSSVYARVGRVGGEG